MQVFKGIELERMWRKGSPPALFVEMYIGTVTMVKGMEIL